MPRLIDDLRANGAKLAMPHFVLEAKQDAWEYLAKRTQEILMTPDLPVLLIDNVAEYFYTSDQEYWDLSKDFPNLAPPFPAFWCESRMVTKIHSKQCGDTDVSSLVPRGRIGALINGLDPEACKGEFPDHTRWILWCELFVDYGMRGVTAMGPHGSTFLAVDAEGKIIDRPWMQSFADEGDAKAMRGYMTFFNPAFLAMSFLHCKNVTLVENKVDPPLARKYKARTGVAPCNYKTLVIEPLKKILRSEGRSDQVGVQKALHICRGHFKDYREGRGLFGRYHQLVWQPSIVRGSKGKSAPPREIEVKI
jgi:hypothetical protein